MPIIYLALAALALAALAGAVAAGRQAAFGGQSVGRQATLAVLAFLLVAVAVGAVFLLWAIWEFTTNFTF